MFKISFITSSTILKLLNNMVNKARVDDQSINKDETKRLFTLFALQKSTRADYLIFALKRR